MDSSTKYPWESKTILFGAITSVLSGIAIFLPGAKVIGDFIAAHGAEIGMVWGVLTIILRTVGSNISLGD